METKDRYPLQGPPGIIADHKVDPPKVQLFGSARCLACPETRYDLAQRALEANAALVVEYLGPGDREHCRTK